MGETSKADGLRARTTMMTTAITLWGKHGGEQYGPRTETVAMPLNNFHDFLAEFAAWSRTAAPEPPAPSPVEGDTEFDAIWSVIKGWDIRRERSSSYHAPTGDDVRAIMRALSASRTQSQEPTP